MTMEAMTETTADELVRGVERAKEVFPGARVKVRRGRLIVVVEDLIIVEPFAWSLSHEQTNPVE